MKSSSNFLLSILAAGFLSAVTALGQTNTPGGTNWVVTITAPDPSASEAGDLGQFRVLRGTNTAGNLPVFLLISGSALNGTDYQAISNRVIIPDGATSVDFTITPLDDVEPEPTESVTARVILPPNGFFQYRIGAPNTATVNITDNDGFVPSNQPPVVNIVQPTNGAVFPAQANIDLRAFAQDLDGMVVSVEFFANSQSLGFGSNVDPNGTVSTNYFLTWSNVPQGTYDLTAQAIDDDGENRFSQVVHIIVGQPPPPTNRPPIVNIIQPTSGTFFLAPATILIRASARDTNGFVASVEFFANNQSIGFGTSTNAAGALNKTFFLTWSNVPPGDYDLTAKATDNEGAMGFSIPVHIFVGTNQPPPIVNIIQPTNGTLFVAPTNILIRASTRDSNGFVASVEFFANNLSLGFGRSTNATSAVNRIFFLTWSNVPPGGYDLTAKATDNDGAMGFSPPVHIFVGTNQPPPPPTNHPPLVNIIQPSNNAAFLAPANVLIRALAQDVDGFVASVEFFANNQSLGFGRTTNTPGAVNGVFFLTWSNVPPGAYDLTAKATDDDSAMGFSPPVHIFVGTNQPPPSTNHPPLVNIVQPTNNAFFFAPANIPIRAFAQDFDGFIVSVEFFANNQSLGFGSRSNANGTVGNLFFLTWSNVPSGVYDLTAKATDDDGEMRFSSPVHIFVGTNQPPPPTNQLAVVNISATDPTASEGLSMWCSNTVLGVNWWWATNGFWHTNWPCPSGTNTATFTVRRSGDTTHALSVYYSIGGTASNGVDYTGLPGVVTIPAGARAAHIVITPVDDNLREGIETVVLRLIPSHDPQANVPYVIGQPAVAAAYITDNDRPPPPCGVLAGGIVHLCSPFTNQCFRVDLSTNLVDWVGVCTNRVADGAAHHLDPDATNCLRQFIRFVPVPCPPDE